MSNPYVENVPPPVIQPPNSGGNSSMPWLIGCGVIGVLGVGACGGGIYFFVMWVIALTQPVVDASDEFAQLLMQGKAKEAYESTGQGWQTGQDEATFKKALEKSGLKDIASVTWGNRSIRNSTGRVDGTVTTKQGATKPIVVRLNYEEEKWKVDSVQYDGQEVSQLQDEPGMKSETFHGRPSDEECQALIRAALANLNESLKMGDIQSFRAKLSEFWKRETNVETLKTLYLTFAESGIDFDSLGTLETEVHSPDSSAAIWLVRGFHYNLGLPKLDFRTKFVREMNSWTLYAIDVRVKQE